MNVISPNNSSVVYIENRTEKTHVTVQKQWKNWQDGTNLDNGRMVTMQLLRNGIVLPGKTVVLGSDREGNSDGLTWIRTWELKQ